MNLRERPGAMTMAMRAASAQPRATQLRVCIVERGRILHDRRLSLAEPLSVGSAESNTFVLSGPELPRSRTLFRAGDGGPSLCLDAHLRGQVTTQGGTRSCSELFARQGGKGEDRVAWPLDEKARGKLLLGGYTLLFELVEAPLGLVHAALPLGVRQSFAKNIDWLFTATVLGSFVLHFAFVVYLENRDWPLVADASEQISVGAQLIWDRPPEPPEPPVSVSLPPSVEDPESVVQAPPVEEKALEVAKSDPLPRPSPKGRGR